MLSDLLLDTHFIIFITLNSYMSNMIHNNPPLNYITKFSILSANVNFNASLKEKVIFLQIHERICRIY